MTGAEPAAPIDRMIEAGDGLKLHVREWPGGAEPPIVCLPGLARSLEDFTEFAGYFTWGAGGPRRVIAISARGRGLSERDPDPARYTVPVEASDVLAILDAMSVTSAFLVGTSRGGLQAMALGSMRADAIKAIVLNDIGPVIDMAGLMRIRGAVGAGTPSSWIEAETRVEKAFGPFFPALTAGDHALNARRTWRDGPDGLETAYDPNLRETLRALESGEPLPPLWELYDALAAIPLMVVRGGLSDILSAETVGEMKRRRPDLAAHETVGQGHAPTLADRPTLQAIARFLSALPK